MASLSPKVIVFGAGGNVGQWVVPALLKANVPVTIATREGSKSTFSNEAKVVTANYDDPANLKSIIKGHNVVISLVNARGVSSQKLLIDAAVATGVEYFLPSEYGHDGDNEELTPLSPIFQSKRKIQAQLRDAESKGLTWTSITTALFFDWGLPFNMFDIDFKSGKAKVWDGGNNRFSAANMRDIADAVTRLVTDVEYRKRYLNQAVYISSVQTTQNEIIAAAEEITGRTFEREDVSSEQFYKGWEGNEDVLTKLKVIEMSGRGYADYARRVEEGKGTFLVDKKSDVKAILREVLATDVKVPEIFKQAKEGN